MSDVRWADGRRGTKPIRELYFQGEWRSMVEWSEYLGIPYATMYQRFMYGHRMAVVFGGARRWDRYKPDSEVILELKELWRRYHSDSLLGGQLSTWKGFKIFALTGGWMPGYYFRTFNPAVRMDERNCQIYKHKRGPYVSTTRDIGL